jgi:hypothetical protein
MARHSYLAGPATRREWMLTVGVASRFYAGAAFGASDFWNRKDPDAWSSDELLQLTTKSPWAQATRVQFKARGRSDGLHSEIGTGRMGGRGEGAPLPEVPTTEVTVRWESAQPVLDALKYPMPPDFAGHYAIGVSDFPAIRKNESPEDVLNQLKTGATLEAKAKDPVGAGVIQRVRAGSTILFGFSKELLPLGPSDKDVLFSLKTAQLVIKAKFEPKEMIYRGKPAM